MSKSREDKTWPPKLSDTFARVMTAGAKRAAGGHWAAVLAKALRREGEADDLSGEVLQPEETSEEPQRSAKKVPMNRV